jgi:hydrogenase expression/formation protein HypC
MCLGVPGKILSLEPNAIGMMMGKVSFGGVAKEVCLAYVPEAQVGDYVIVHAGFALNTMNEDEANEVFVLLQQMGELVEVELERHSESDKDWGFAGTGVEASAGRTGQ